MEGRPLADATAERTLVERARHGDAAAYATLVEGYSDAAYRTALAITGEAAEAQDAAQDAFVKAYYALARFQAGAPFRPWLLRIVANEARNRRVAAGRRQALAARATLDAGADGTHFAPSPEEATLDAERRAAVLSAVRQLRDDDRRVIAGRFFLGLSEHEMAGALGIARGTVKSRLSRALERLRRTMPAVVVAALVLAGLAAALLVPPVRDAIAGRLGLRGIGIRHLGSVPTPDPAVSLGPSIAALSLGERVTLQTARQRLPSLVVLPALRELGSPDQVYVANEPPGGRLSLVYGARPQLGIAPAAPTGVGALFTTFRGSIAQEFIQKGIGPGSRLESANVGGATGYWIEGQPHLFMYRDARGQVRDESLRLAGNTLIWEQGDLTLRLESNVPRETALRIATSVQ